MHKTIHPSAGRTGVRHDNAMTESFFTAIKTEWPNRFVFLKISTDRQTAHRRRLRRWRRDGNRHRYPVNALIAWGAVKRTTAPKTLVLTGQAQHD
ncbi:hypothetical protein [Streptosporangium sp. NPDC049376]|uniref:hypothetical protein n=1 Tax=Streptosporangium sp. NPDC049376 TaxID=3366192 RepID=UPI00378D9A3A